MLVDARKLPSGNRLTAAVCVIGAGAAGITLAREFAGTATDIIVLESGGTAYDSAAQALARGKNIGLEYFDLEGERVRQLGGCTGHWGGECRPLDPEDFSVRDWVPYSGWPFGRTELEPYYRRATKVVEIGEYDRFQLGWDEITRANEAFQAIRFTTGNVHPRAFQNSPPTRMGTRYGPELDAAKNIQVLLNANLTGFETEDDGKTVTGAKVACLGGPNLTVAARVFVLAAGTIENARLLLIASGPDGKGFGNEHGMVGRFFQEHIAHRELAHMVPASRPSINAYKASMQQGSVAAAFTEAAQRERKLPNFLIFFDAYLAGSEPPPIRSFKAIVGGVREQTVPDRFWTHLGNVMSDLPGVTRYAFRRMSTPDEPVGYFEIGFVAEQVPNPDSRVRLGKDRDAFGLPLVELNWQLTDLDRAFMLRALDHTVREVGASGLGRVKIVIPENGDGWLNRISPSHHPMGTTRMHSDPRQGVVDANCRVHGMANLYVASASVFPCSGAGSPTYTVVTLAIRLADHLKQQIA